MGPIRKALEQFVQPAWRALILLGGALIPLSGGKLGRGWSLSKRPEVPCIGSDGSNDNTPFDRHQIYAHHGDAHPPIDDDALVENAVQNVKKGRLASRGSLNPHVDSLASAISEPVP